LAVHADHVLSIEIEPELAAQASASLHGAGVTNVRVETADGFAVMLPEDEKFDVIVLAGGIGRLPAELPARLKIGGRLLAFVGRVPVQTVRLVTRVDQNGFRVDNLFETYVAPLRNAPMPAQAVL
jgi:protein-L-isoaspartate(D-aspartate) O-methyltransferase